MRFTKLSSLKYRTNGYNYVIKRNIKTTKKNRVIQLINNFKKSSYFNEFLILTSIISISIYNLTHIILNSLKIANDLLSFNSLYLAVLVCLELSSFLLTLLLWIIFIILYWNRLYL